MKTKLKLIAIVAVIVALATAPACNLLDAAEDKKATILFFSKSMYSVRIQIEGVDETIFLHYTSNNSLTCDQPSDGLMYHKIELTPRTYTATLDFSTGRSYTVNFVVHEGCNLLDANRVLYWPQP